MERRPRRAKRALVKARGRASEELSRQGPFGLKMAALASRSETLRRRSSRYRLPRVLLPPIVGDHCHGLLGRWAAVERLPRDPNDASQSPSDPAVERGQLAPLAEAEIAGPAPQVWDPERQVQLELGWRSR